ncbi:DUF3106 domain-containing protein [Cupriavidus plantarum]|uniref:Uncharacterized protein DUF3106 n=1 Tax=Cupriavidus plantarum TaxID=942865 RepID=A0A316FK89_9BURK|nr:DUF3106 domain-containing protein [Cupriavidus plantarum]PWK38040.1 uncharacterized protein DUF3106 [Cupriavidus plantarum]
MARALDLPDAGLPAADLSDTCGQRLRVGLVLLALASGVALSCAPAVQAQGQAQGQANAPASASASSAVQPGPVINAHPTWAELSAAHQRILAPLEPLWNSIPELNRHKWLRIADQYPKYSPDEQARLQARMAEWVRMTPQQRRLARENYQITRSLTPEAKAEAWKSYQQLPEEQKKNLAAADKVPRRPGAVSALPSGKKLPTLPSRGAHPQQPGTKTAASAPAAPASAASAAVAAASTPAVAASTGAASAASATTAAAAASAPVAATPASATAPQPAATPLGPPVTGEASTDFPITGTSESR